MVADWFAGKVRVRKVFRKFLGLDGAGENAAMLKNALGSAAVARGIPSPSRGA